MNVSKLRKQIQKELKEMKSTDAFHTKQKEILKNLLTNIDMALGAKLGFTSTYGTKNPTLMNKKIVEACVQAYTASQKLLHDNPNQVDTREREWIEHGREILVDKAPSDPKQKKIYIEKLINSGRGNDIHSAIFNWASNTRFTIDINFFPSKKFNVQDQILEDEPERREESKSPKSKP